MLVAFDRIVTIVRITAENDTVPVILSPSLYRVRDVITIILLLTFGDLRGRY